MNVGFSLWYLVVCMYINISVVTGVFLSGWLYSHITCLITCCKCNITEQSWSAWAVFLWDEIKPKDAPQECTYWWFSANEQSVHKTRLELDSSKPSKSESKKSESSDLALSLYRLTPISEPCLHTSAAHRSTPEPSEPVLRKSALPVVLYTTYVSLITFALVSYLAFIYFEFYSTFHFSGSP